MASQTSYPQPPYPLHDSVKDLLDPEYVQFYNQYLINAPQVHYQPVAASRVGGKLIPVSFCFKSDAETARENNHLTWIREEPTQSPLARLWMFSSPERSPRDQM